MTYRFEAYSPEYKAQVADLRSRTWGGDTDFNIKYFEWKYEQSPYFSEPQFYVTLHRDRVVGMRGFMGSRWQVGDNSDSVLIPIGGDLAVDADHRRQKIAARMLIFVTEHMAAKGHPYLMNLSANSSSRLLQIRSKYPRVVPYQTYQHPKPSTNIVARGYRRVVKKLIGYHGVPPFRRFDNWAGKTQGLITGSRRPRLSEMSDLALRCADKSRIQLIKDDNFYTWRFGNPSSAYRFIFYEKRALLEGFLVLQSSRHGGWTTIIDWETSTPAIWNELVAAAAKSNAKQLRITSTGFSQSQIQTLRDQGIKLVVNRDSANNPAPGMLLHAKRGTDTNVPYLGGLHLFDAKNWDIRMIASDAF